MKKLLILFALMLFSISLFADSGNYQKIYPIDDEIYEDITDLYILSGYSLPSTSGPWSGTELKMMLEKIDYSALEGVAKSLYDSIRERLCEEAFSPVFEFNPAVNLEAYLSSNTDYFHGWDNWFYKEADAKQAVDLASEEHVGENFYGYINFVAGITTTHYPFERAIGDSLLWTNIPFIGVNNMSQIDFASPYRAFVAAGGDNFSFFVGRERLSWGPGVTGNYIIGDHIKYHNAAKISAFEENFKYTFLLSAFPHPQNYFIDGQWNPYGEKATAGELNGTDAGQSQFVNGISMLIAHRMEWRLFENKVGFSVSEGVMYMHKDNRIDLIALSPAHIYHNTYTRSLTNSILGFELDWTPFTGLNLYAQLVVDEMFLPGEPVPGDVNAYAAEPTAMGYMLGATYKKDLGEGVLSVGAELSITDPYLYLRDADYQIEGNSSRYQKVGDWGINYVVALRKGLGGGGAQYYEEQFLGYKYGGDAVIADLSASYRVSGKYTLGAELFYMAHGTHDKWTVWTRVNNVYDPATGTTGFVENSTTPTDKHVTDNHRDPNAQLRDSIEHTFVFALRGGVDLGAGFSINAELDYLTVVNPGNLKANGKESALQMVLGVTWAY
ncbi:MAG: hypothetical protein J6R23_03035 [Spirochaetales bacterium]|nr:hypothetical protein [Spirochaetales bacterium]